MLPIQFIEKKYSFLPNDLFDIFMELRNIIATAKPDVTEELTRNSVTYYDSKKGGHVSAGVCSVVFCDNHIEVHFIHGTFLPDPQHLLRGERKYKRFLLVDKFDSAPWEAIRDLITASSLFDPYTQTFKAG
jgi:hypothetical protein